MTEQTPESLGLYGADALRWNMRRFPELFEPQGKPARVAYSPPDQAALIRAIAAEVRGYVDHKLSTYRPSDTVLEGIAQDLGEPLTEYVAAQVMPMRKLLDELSGRTVARCVWSPDLELKAINSELREFEGVASSVSQDLAMDVLEPKGAIFKTPLPLCFQHDITNPVGEVTFAQVNNRNIEFRARIPRIEEEGLVKQNTDRAWHMVRYRICKSVSVGFIPKASEPIQGGGTRYTRWLWTELSVVTSPCQPDAQISVIRSPTDEVMAELSRLRERVTELETRRYSGVAKSREAEDDE